MSILFCIRSAPCKNELAKSAFDTIFTYATFEFHIDILFLDAGVLQLLTHKKEKYYLSKLLDMLPIYGIKQIYVELESFDFYNIKKKQLYLPIQIINQNEFPIFISNYNFHLIF